MTPPAGPVQTSWWTEPELVLERDRATENFRHARMEEPLEAYIDAFEERQDAFQNLFKVTEDLTRLRENALAVVGDPRLLEACRYLAGPPISLDDLKVVANATSVSVRTLVANPELPQKLVDTVMLGIDRRRFPWLVEGREPTDGERHAAVLASAALLASQRVATDRRSEGKSEQESMVESVLIRAGFKKVETRVVNTIQDGPGPGEFCRESMLGTRKADLLVGLYDRRLMPIEAKVSNSYTNSIKRLNNDAAVKAGIWLDEFGRLNVVPTAVLSGVYKLKHLLSAQVRGLSLFWAHDLDKLTEWIAQTKP